MKITTVQEYRYPQIRVWYSQDCGYAVAIWNKEAAMWQQVSPWYLTKRNFNRYAGAKYNLHI